MKTFKPMLAATIDDTSLLEFPMVASPKLDGIRAIVMNGVVVSRNLKPIPNHYVQQKFGRIKHNGLDGELIMGDPTDKAAFRKTSSAVMSHDGEPEVDFHVFDLYTVGHLSFYERLEKIIQKPLSKIVVVKQQVVINLDVLLEVENEWLGLGYEGVMLRDIEGLYKFGRSTLRERGLLKLKRFCDSEAKIIG